MTDEDRARIERVNNAYHEWAESPGGRRYGRDPWAAFQAGYLTAIDSEPYPASKVPMPQGADQAVGMYLVAENWLKHNAPERLRSPTTTEAANQGGERNG